MFVCSRNEPDKNKYSDILKFWNVRKAESKRRYDIRNKEKMESDALLLEVY